MFIVNIVVVTYGDEVMNLSDLLVHLLLGKQYYGFLQRNAERCILARGIPSVCLSVRHVPVSCPDE